MKATALSLVIPAYNEESRLPATLRQLAALVSELADKVEILLVDDGSQDGTAAAAETLGRDLQLDLRVLRQRRNQGKGAAVARGIGAAQAEVVAFTDADCPYDLRVLTPILSRLESGELDLAIGARDLPDSQINRGYGLLRQVSGRAGSLLTWLAIGLPYRDSQCGLKAFRTDVARRLFARRTVDGFGFDFEILAAAVVQGLRIQRFPVRLTHNDDSRVDVVRDSLRALRDLWRVRRNLRRRAYVDSGLTTKRIACPLCGDRSYTPRIAQDGLRMVECLSCGLWFLNPMPTPEALRSVYTESYFCNDRSASIGYDDYAARADECRATFAQRMDFVRPYVAEGRILDVGAGFGYLVDAARGVFEERWALEMSASAAGRIAQDHRIVQGAFETADLPAGYFDVVSMQDAFEHLPDPRPVLAKVRKILRPGGAFFVVTPDVRSWLARLEGERWVSLKFPEHVVLYSEATLRQALEEAGFQVQLVEPSSQYMSIRFLASRAFPWSARASRALERLVVACLGPQRQVYVPSGSITAIATVPRLQEPQRTGTNG